MEWTNRSDSAKYYIIELDNDGSGELEEWVISKEQGDMEDLPDQLGEWNCTLEKPTVTLDQLAQSDLADLLPPGPNL